MTVIIELADGAIKEYGTVLRFNDKDYFTICGQDVGKNLEGCNHLACALSIIQSDYYDYPGKSTYDLVGLFGVLLCFFSIFGNLINQICFYTIFMGIVIALISESLEKETRNKIEAELREFDKYKTIGGVPGRLV